MTHRTYPGAYVVIAVVFSLSSLAAIGASVANPGRNPWPSVVLVLAAVLVSMVLVSWRKLEITEEGISLRNIDGTFALRYDEIDWIGYDVIPWASNTFINNTSLEIEGRDGTRISINPRGFRLKEIAPLFEALRTHGIAIEPAVAWDARRFEAKIASYLDARRGPKPREAANEMFDSHLDT